MNNKKEKMGTEEGGNLNKHNAIKNYKESKGM